MSSQDWTPTIGLRNAALSLLWRTAVAATLWIAMLWGFHAVLQGIGVTRVPLLIAIGFALLTGTISGFIISRGLEERAGFMGPVLALLAAVFAAIAIIGGEALFARLFPVASGELRFMIVAGTMLLACVWIVKHVMLDV